MSTRKEREHLAKLESAYAAGKQAGISEGKRELLAANAEARRLESERLRTTSIDAICHAITALARLIDGRDAR